MKINKNQLRCELDIFSDVVRNGALETDIYEVVLKTEPPIAASDRFSPEYEVLNWFFNKEDADKLRQEKEDELKRKLSETREYPYTRMEYFTWKKKIKATIENA